MRHLLLHDEKNKHCDVCNEVVVTRVPKVRRKDPKKYEQFGEMVSLDHVDVHTMEQMAYMVSEKC